jgi:hypothetical protein
MAGKVSKPQEHRVPLAEIGQDNGQQRAPHDYDSRCQAAPGEVRDQDDQEVDHAKIITGMNPLQCLPGGLQLLRLAMPVGERSQHITNYLDRPPEQQRGVTVDANACSTMMAIRFGWRRRSCFVMALMRVGSDGRPVRSRPIGILLVGFVHGVSPFAGSVINPGPSLMLDNSSKSSGCRLRHAFIIVIPS